MNTGKIALSVMAGVAAAGAVLGILYAPDKGYKTRKKLSRKREDLKDNLTDMFDSTKEEANDFIEKGRSVIHNVNKRVNSMRL